MLYPAAVSAAAAAVWLLAVLGPGLSLPAEDDSEPDFTLCSHCFYRQTPPQGASAGPPLRPVCHRLPGGQAFATLSRPTCDTAVYSAFHLSHGWTEREGVELMTEEENSIKVTVPSLLRGGGDPSHHVSPADSPLQHWDSTVTTLVQSSITPQCSALGGDLYILTGVGRLGAADDGDRKWQTQPLWSAVCCAVPGGKSSFSVGLIRETEEGERQVSVKELQEVLGVAELFSEGCGEAGGETAVTAGLHNEGLPGNIGEEETNGDVDSHSQDLNEDIRERSEKQGADAQLEEANVADALGSDSSNDKQHDLAHSGAAQSSGDYEVGDEQDTNSTSTLLYILSTTLSILKAPLHPVVSTVTQFPGQVSYVLQEDLGVLSALPGETFTLFHLLTSDLLSWVGTAGEMLFGIVETCFFSVYCCTSSMLGALLDSCHIGVTGMGTLAGDTVGVFGDALDNAWWVTRFFGGRLWEQSEGYVGTVMSEMGGQAQAVGGGFGKLVRKSGNGVCNVFRLGWGLITGVVDIVIGAISEGFGQESQ